MVIFHSYVSLPEGSFIAAAKKIEQWQVMNTFLSFQGFFCKLPAVLMEKHHKQFLLQKWRSPYTSDLQIWSHRFSDFQSVNPPMFDFFGRVRCPQFLTFGYGSIPIDTFLVGWTSIYQLFWCSPGGHPHLMTMVLRKWLEYEDFPHLNRGFIQLARAIEDLSKVKIEGHGFHRYATNCQRVYMQYQYQYIYIYM